MLEGKCDSKGDAENILFLNKIQHNLSEMHIKIIQPVGMVRHEC